MGRARLIGESLITAASMMTLSSLATGIVTRAQKDGSGSAIVTTEGDFSGSADLDYLVQIDAAGEVGTATFLWSDDGGATIDATLVTTLQSLITLNNGVKIAFAPGSGTDCALYDAWRFKGVLPYGPGKGIDRDRDTECRTGDPTSGAITLDFDFTAAVTPRVVILFDHNLTAGAEISLVGSDSSTFATIGVSFDVPYRATHLLRYLEAYSYRYWRLTLRNTANTDGYLRWSEVFLGPYTELAVDYDLGDTLSRSRLGERERQLSGRFFGGLNALARVFGLRWAALSSTDRDALVDLYVALSDVTNRTVRPVYFNPDSDDASELYLCEWLGDVTVQSLPEAPERFATGLIQLVEIPRTV